MANQKRGNKTSGGARKGAGGGSGKIWKTVFAIIFVIVAIPLGYVGARVYQQLKDMPDISILEKYEPIEAIQIFDKNDHLVCTVEGDEDRRVVPLSQISTQMQQAILAAEDHYFYEHHGINPMSIVRATLANLQAGKVKEGGSTITMQLIKNLFFEDHGRTMDRKVKEAFMSYEVERRYSKDRILEMYLNQVYFGNGGYGIERAAQRYFDRSAGSLSLAQSAFLAGLVKAPSEMGNPNNRKIAIDRQHEILNKMVEYGYVTRDQAKKAEEEPLVFKKGINPLQKYPYYISYVLEQLRGRFSEAEMRRQGLKVFTNLDPQVQELAEKTLNDDIKKAPKGVSQAALATVSVKDGAVIALVGGVGNFWNNQFNRATNPHTAGSSFKPFVYLTAFLKDQFRPDSMIEDSPLTIKQGWGLPDWSPKNFDHKFMGKITVRRALTLSRNVPAVRIGKAVGVDSVIETARLAGITTRLDPNLSLSLGSSAVTPLDMAGAYATFARGGVAIKPQVLRRIENNRGQIIEAFEPRVDKVFDTDATARLVDILQDVVKVGTGAGAKLPNRPVAGKTGTADAAKDIWFVGFTPDTVTAVWGGNDENLPIPGHNVTGGVVMAKIWKDFMTAYYTLRPTPAGSFIAPSKQVEQFADVGGGEGDVTTTSPELPKLVPVEGSGVAVDDEQPRTEYPVSGAFPPNEGAPPPAYVPPVNVAPLVNVAPPEPMPVPAPNTVRTAPVPAPVHVPVPVSNVPAVAPSYAPPTNYSYNSAVAPRVAPPAVVVGADGRTKKTIINEDAPARYSSGSDPTYSPGLYKKRFSPGSGSPGL